MSALGLKGSRFSFDVLGSGFSGATPASGDPYEEPESSRMVDQVPTMTSILYAFQHQPK